MYAGKCVRCGKEDKFDPKTWKCLECGNFRRPKRIRPPPPVHEIITNPKFWKNKKMTYMKSVEYYDQDIRTGVCYFCKKEGRANKTRRTYLHHLFYNHSDPLEWTVEVCGSCHWHVDPYNKQVMERRLGKIKKRIRR